MGSYTVTVTLKGEYSGTKKASFEIVPKGTSVSNVTAKRKALALEWKKQTSQTTGYQIQYSTSEKFMKKTTETVTIRKGGNQRKPERDGHINYKKFLLQKRRKHHKI